MFVVGLLLFRRRKFKWAVFDDDALYYLDCVNPFANSGSVLIRRFEVSSWKVSRKVAIKFCHLFALGPWSESSGVSTQQDGSIQN